MGGRAMAIRSAIAALLVLVWTAISPVTAQAEASTTLPDRASLERSGADHGVLFKAVRFSLVRREMRQFTYLADWPAAELERLQVWLGYGIRFDGPWNSDELAQVLDVMDAFAAAYGERRFVEVTSQAVSAVTWGLRHSLHVVRARGIRVPAAYWNRVSGRIYLNDGVFDDRFVLEHYYWRFLWGDDLGEHPEDRIRITVIGHELGHVLIDGLRGEARRAGAGRHGLESLYEQTVDRTEWPHEVAVANENLATELALWALGVERTPQVMALRANLTSYLAPHTPVLDDDRPATGDKPSAQGRAALDRPPGVREHSAGTYATALAVLTRRRQYGSEACTCEFSTPCDHDRSRSSTPPTGCSCGEEVSYVEG